MNKDNQKQQVHWFPGHMRAALNEISEKIKSIDLVVEIGDARAPKSSLNPYLKKVLGNKKKVLVFSKKDRADKYKISLIEDYYKDEYERVVFADLLNPKDGIYIKGILEGIKRDVSPKYLAYNVKPLPKRVLVVGIPNVGKSTFVNLLAKNKKAKVGNTPGFTKAQQLIKVSDDLELCDTPGILPAAYEDKEVAMHLAWLGTIKQDILPLDTLALSLSEFLMANYFDYLKKRYELEEKLSSEDFIKYLATYRHFLMKNGELDIERAQKVLLKEFESGKIGGVLIDDLERI